MAKTKIHWGILGPGKIAHTFASDLQGSENAVLYGVASRDNQKARAFSEKFNAIKHYSSYEELVCDPAIDVVYIATPHVFHFEHTMLCLKHGKSVLCEKPMGMDSDQVDQMIKEAKSRNLFLMEGIWTRFIPATEKLIELLSDNVIGEILFLHADFGFLGDRNPQGRLYNKNLGGGSLMDIGIYPVYLSLLVLGQPDTIQSTARMTDTGVDSYLAMLLDFKNDAKAVLESTFEANTAIEAVIFGRKGHIKLHRRFHHTEKISVYRNEAGTEDLELPYKGNGYLHEIEEVNYCLTNNKTESEKLPLRMSFDLITVLDRIKSEIGLKYISRDGTNSKIK